MWKPRSVNNHGVGTLWLDQRFPESSEVATYARPRSIERPKWTSFHGVTQYVNAPLDMQHSDDRTKIKNEQRKQTREAKEITTRDTTRFNSNETYNTTKQTQDMSHTHRMVPKKMDRTRRCVGKTPTCVHVESVSSS